MKKAVISLNDNEIEISNSDRVLFITGAGISVASGLPTIEVREVFIQTRRERLSIYCQPSTWIKDQE